MMNERIKELEQQCVYWDADDETYEFDREKFAELIVKECAKTIESQDVDPSFKNRMSWAIKTKFGIES